MHGLPYLKFWTKFCNNTYTGSEKHQCTVFYALNLCIYRKELKYTGHAVAQLDEALLHISQGQGFDSRLCLWHDPSGRTIALESTQPLTEKSIRYSSWRVRAASSFGWQPYHLHVLIVLKSGNTQALSRPVQGLFYLLTEVPIFAHVVLKLNCIEIMKFLSLFLVSLP
jgi:hypothetical protein